MVLLLYFSGHTLLLCLCEWALQPTKLCSTTKYIFEVKNVKLISMNTLLSRITIRRLKNIHTMFYIGSVIILQWLCILCQADLTSCWIVKLKLNLRTWKCHALFSFDFICTQRGAKPLDLSVVSKLSALTVTQNFCKYPKGCRNQAQDRCWCCDQASVTWMKIGNGNFQHTSWKNCCIFHGYNCINAQ